MTSVLYGSAFVVVFGCVSNINLYVRIKSLAKRSECLSDCIYEWWGVAGSRGNPMECQFTLHVQFKNDPNGCFFWKKGHCIDFFGR